MASMVVYDFFFNVMILAKSQCSWGTAGRLLEGWKEIQVFPCTWSRGLRVQEEWHS